MSRRTKDGIGKVRSHGERAETGVGPSGHWLLALSFLIALIAYLPTLRYGFVFDDVQQIVENPAIRSWSGVPQYFTAHVGAGVFPWVKGSFYRPLFLMWLRFNYIFFQASPWGWHLSSLLAHLAAVWMFFVLVRQWTREGIIAGWAALLFAAHPIHIEPVAWISAVPEILFTIAGLASIYCYFRFRVKGRQKLLVASAALYAIALLAKETAVVIWPVIFVCQRWLEDGVEREQASSPWLNAVKEQIPFAAITGGYFVLRVIALHGMRGDITHPLREILCAAPSVTWFYLRKLALPVQLSQLYYDSDVWSFSSPHFFLPLIAVCAVAVGLAVWALKSRNATLPVILLALSLVPPLMGMSIFPRHDLVHNRYLYLPSAGACMLLALALRKATDPAMRFVKTGGASAIVVVLSAALILPIWAQETPYKDNVALFSRSVELAPESAMAWGLLGEEYMTMGRNDAGIVAFQRAQALEPGVLLNNYRLAAAYYQVRNMPWAEAYFERALNTYHNPDVVTYDYCLYRLGLAQYAQGKMSEAEASLQRAVELQPKGFGYHLALGAALKYEGKAVEAKRQFELELQLGPDSDASALLRSIDSGGSAPRPLNTITVH
jgi:tetratricopeptide (TPR) repeat protein